MDLSYLKLFEHELRKLADSYGLELFTDDGMALLRDPYYDALNATFIVKGTPRPIRPRGSGYPGDPLLKEFAPNAT